jgi:hypothetical protein
MYTDAELTVRNETQADEVAVKLSEIEKMIVSLSALQNRQEVGFLLGRLIWANSQLERYETNKDYDRLFFENTELKTLLNQALEVVCPSDCQKCLWAKYCNDFSREVQDEKVKFKRL